MIQLSNAFRTAFLRTPHKSSALSTSFLSLLPTSKSSSYYNSFKDNVRLYMSKDKPDINPFTTWSFDKPCEQMDMTDIPTPLLSISDRPWISAMETSDLAIIGVFGPETDDDEEEESDEEQEVVLEGMAKELDDTLDGALKELIKDNQKAFKNGAAAGTTTPALRIVTVGSDGKSKVR